MTPFKTFLESDEPEVRHTGRVKILRGPFKDTAAHVVEQLPGRHYKIDNGFGEMTFHHDDLEPAPKK